MFLTTKHSTRDSALHPEARRDCERRHCVWGGQLIQWRPTSHFSIGSEDNTPPRLIARTPGTHLSPDRLNSRPQVRSVPRLRRALHHSHAVSTSTLSTFALKTGTTARLGSPEPYRIHLDDLGSCKSLWPVARRELIGRYRALALNSRLPTSFTPACRRFSSARRAAPGA